MRKYILSIILCAGLLAGCGVVNTPPAPPKEPQDHCIVDGCMLPTTTTTTECWLPEGCTVNEGV